MNHSFVVSDDGASTWSLSAAASSKVKPKQAAPKEAKQ